MTESTESSGQFSLRALLVLPVFAGCYMLAVRYLTRPDEVLGWRLVQPLLMFLAIGWLISQIVVIVVGLWKVLWGAVCLLRRWSTGRGDQT